MEWSSWVDFVYGPFLSVENLSVFEARGSIVCLDVIHQWRAVVYLSLTKLVYNFVSMNFYQDHSTSIMRKHLVFEQFLSNICNAEKSSKIIPWHIG